LDKTNLSIIYTDQEVIDVTSDDGVRVGLTGTSPTYLLHQYKIRANNNNDSMLIHVNLQTTLSPTSSPVYLQIWNVTTSLWETIATEDSTAENVDFYLVGRITSNQNDYYDKAVSDLNFPETYDLNEVTIRVYQYNV